MEISCKKSQKGICLGLEGELTIQGVSNLKETLLKHLSEESSLEVNLEGVTHIDTAGLQILYAAQKTAVQQGKVLSLKRPSSAFLEAARLAGLLFQTEEGHLEGCLWKGGIRECHKLS
ncbi:MAG: lipid asymmetry maintenance protein MlaB [bacterium]